MKLRFFAAFSIGFVSFSLLGFIGTILHLSWDHFQKTKERIAINVYFDEGISEQDKLFIGRTISQMAGVKKVEYLGGDEAKLYFVREYPNYAKVMDLFKHVPLPEGFRITLKSQFLRRELLEHVLSEIQSLSGVAEVSVKVDWIDKLSQIIDSIEIAIFFISILAAFAVFFALPHVFALIFSKQSGFSLTAASLCSGITALFVVLGVSKAVGIGIDVLIAKILLAGSLTSTFVAQLIKSNLSSSPTDLKAASP